MRTKKIGHVGAVLFAFPIITGACEPSTPKTVMVLADVSRTVPAADVEIYAKSFSAIIRELSPGDRLVFGRISGQSVRDFTLDYDETLPNTGVYVNDVEARDSLLALAESAFTAILQNRNSPESDILSALVIAGEVFSRNARGTEAWLVIMSDMRQESPTLNVNLQGMDSAFTSGFLRREREAGRMPDLSNVRVRVVGAGASDRATDSYVALREFWLAYLAAAGAQMKPADYGRIALVSLGQ